MKFIKHRVKTEYCFHYPFYIPQFKILFLPWIDYKEYEFMGPNTVLFLDFEAAKEFIQKKKKIRGRWMILY